MSCPAGHIWGHRLGAMVPMVRQRWIDPADMTGSETAAPRLSPISVERLVAEQLNHLNVERGRQLEDH